MSTAKVQEKQKAQTGKNTKSTAQFADSLYAITEIERRTSELLGIARHEPEAYIKKVWAEMASAEGPTLYELPVTRFRAPGLRAAFAQANGMAMAGKRVAILGSRLDAGAENLPQQLAPFVAHRFSTGWISESNSPMFELLARTPQQASHFALIARKLAEQALVPGMLHCWQSFDRIHYERIQKIPFELIKMFLGRPSDIIATPTTTQQQFFGAKRRRLPEFSDEAQMPDTALFWRDLLPLCFETMRYFEEVTGIAYQPVETVHVDKAELILVTTGALFQFLQENLARLEMKSNTKIGLLHPTLLRPFPGGLVNHLLQRKKACLVISQASDEQAKALLRKIRLAFDKAFANGLAAPQASGALPFPDHPVYTKLTDRPELHGAIAGQGELDLDALSEVLQNLATHARFPQEMIALSGEAKIASATRSVAAKGLFHLAIRSADAHRIGKSIATHFSSLLPFHLSCHADLQHERAHVFFSRRKAQSPMPKAAFDACLIGPDELADFGTKSLQIKKDGALLILASSEEIAEQWPALPEQVRQQLSDKNLRVFAIEAPLDTRPNRAQMRGQTLGALLKLAELCSDDLFTSERVAAAMEAFASNGNLQYAKKAQSGYESLTALDVTALEQSLAEQLLEEKSAVARMEPAGEPSAETSSKPDDAFKTQMRFCQFGQMPETSTGPALTQLTPALLFDKTDLARIRHAYPVCLPTDDSERFAISLADLFDDLMKMETENEADNERLYVHLQQLETEIKKQASRQNGQLLSRLWDKAAAALLHKSSGDTKSQEIRQKNYRAAKKALAIDGPVYFCDADMPVALFAAAVKFVSAKKFETFEREIDSLEARLFETLQADFAKSSQAHDPEYLKATVGAADSEELDFDQLAHLLAEKPTDLQAQKSRAQRIERIWLTIKALRSLFTRDGAPKVGAARNATLAGAIGQAMAHYRRLLEFFRAVHIARLEMMNKYREDRHDRYFASFGFTDLSADEFALLPPFPVHLRAASWHEIDRSALIELLSSELPIKVLITIEQAESAELLETGATTSADWPIKLAEMAQTLNSAFVLQTGSADLDRLTTGLQDGIFYRGPALFSIFTGTAQAGQRLAPYLQAAAAMESRVAPAFMYNPAAGATLADQMTIALTPQYERDWPTESLAYTDAQGENAAMDVAFTPADFWAMNAESARHFLASTARHWHENMLPLAEFVQDFEVNAGQKIPFIWMIDRRGTLYRTLVSYSLAARTWRSLRAWHALQELGGVNNSHARKLLLQEKEKLAAQQQEKIEALKAEHKQQLEKAVSQVAEEIVANIAAGLLDQSTTAPVPATATATATATGIGTAASAPPPESESVVEESAPAEEAEEEPEELSLDEAYIETVRCTSCNECTNRNPKMFAYNADKQAYIKDINAGTYRDLVESAEKCPVRIIHPGKPINPDEPGLEDLLKRAEPFL